MKTRYRALSIVFVAAPLLMLPGRLGAACDHGDGAHRSPLEDDEWTCQGIEQLGSFFDGLRLGDCVFEAHRLPSAGLFRTISGTEPIEVRVGLPGNRAEYFEVALRDHATIQSRNRIGGRFTTVSATGRMKYVLVTEFTHEPREPRRLLRVSITAYARNEAGGWGSSWQEKPAFELVCESPDA